MTDDRCIRCGNPVSRKGAHYCSKRCRYLAAHGNILILTLKKKWFDMILSEKKLEEYREIKPYWTKRFNNYFGQYWDFSSEEPEIAWSKEKKLIKFRNGYGNSAPEFTAECSIREDVGQEDWGAEAGKKYYVLTIHRVL